MGKPEAGDVVIIPFPFSDLRQTRRRPALVPAGLDGDDLTLCMITSRDVRDRYAMPLDASDFAPGGLPVPSNIGPSRPFIADAAIILKVVGRLKSEKLFIVCDKVAELLGR